MGGRGEGSKRWAVEDSARPPNNIQQKAATYPLTLPAWTMHRALAALLVLLLAVISVAVATFEVGIPGGDLAAAGSFQVRCLFTFLPLRPLPAALTDSDLEPEGRKAGRSRDRIHNRAGCSTGWSVAPTSLLVTSASLTFFHSPSPSACKLHAVALSHLAILPSLSTPSSPIAPGPQVFLQLSTASSLRSSNVVVRLVIWLRDRYWREGYNARQVNGGMGLAGGKGGKKKREEVIRRIREVERLLEEAVEGGCEAAWETRGKFNLVRPLELLKLSGCNNILIRRSFSRVFSSRRLL